MSESDEPEKKKEKRAKKKKRASSTSDRPVASETSDRPVAPESRFRTVWIVIAGLYLCTVWLDGVGSTWPAKITPRPWLYFSQVAALFVKAAPKVIEYRAEGWSCSEKRWTEIDVHGDFRIDADNKENRFQRALQFYRKNRPVMRALEDYILKRHNAAGANLGGVRFSSLRLAYPKPGEHVEPYVPRPLSVYSGDEKHAWYWTPTSRRAERCGHASDSSKEKEKDDDTDHSRDKDKDDKDLDP